MRQGEVGIKTDKKNDYKKKASDVKSEALIFCINSLLQNQISL